MRKKTIILLFASAIGLSVYDLYAADKEGVEATISQVITEGAKQRPIIAVFFGVLMGHWFWS